MIHDLDGTHQPNDATTGIAAVQVVISIRAPHHGRAVGSIFDHFVGQTVSGIWAVADGHAPPVAFSIVDVCFGHARVLLITQAGIVLRPGDGGPLLFHSGRPD